MKPKAWMKSENLYSLWSLPSATVQPGRPARASVSSGPENFRVKPLWSYARNGRSWWRSLAVAVRLRLGAAVDGDGGATDVTRGIRCKPEQKAGDGLGCDPFGRVGCRHGGAIGGSVYDARQDCVDRNAVVFYFERDGFHQSDQSGFRDAVGCEVGHRIECSARTDGDNASLAGFDHSRQDGAEDGVGGSQIQIDHLVPRFVGGFGYRLAAGESADQMQQGVDRGRLPGGFG